LEVYRLSGSISVLLDETADRKDRAMSVRRHPSQPLPEHLAVHLPADTREALQHSVRRQILRTLQATDRTMSVSDLAKSDRVPCGMPCVSHHLHTLRDFGLIERVETQPVRGAIKHYFTSSIDDDGHVTRVLRATEQADRQR
jgi:predicted transcriptional regulator